MQKEYKSVQKYIVMGPRKLRKIADLAKKLSPAAAVEKLPFVAKRASEPLIKTIKSAIAQAKLSGISETDLIFKEIQINEGPRLKRGRAASRGRYHPFKRRMSHIRVVLAANQKSKVLESKENLESKPDDLKVKIQRKKKVGQKIKRKEEKSK